MSRKAVFNLVLVIALIGALVIAFGLTRYYSDLPQRLSQHETIVVGQNRFIPGSQAAIRVLVRDSSSGAPLANAEVQVTMQPRAGGKALALYTGQTGPGGTAKIAFHVSENVPAEESLVIQTRSKLGSDTIERLVTVERDYRVLLTTDKPLYQPGQVIHVRALALSAFDLRPAAGQSLEITIADGKGNKVFRQPLTTTDYGAAFTDFQLADEVNTGAYKISAALGNTSSEKTINVEHYVLPKFELKLKTEQPFYMPGQHVQGTLHAGYFFGKPVSDSEVKLEGFTFDVQRSQVFSLEGKTDSEGSFPFEFDLPAYLAGSDMDSGQARFYLQASVTDQAKHAESSDLSFPVSASGINIQAVPEGGNFRAGLENILYVLTSTPDGSPVLTSLVINFQDGRQPIQVKTGEYGLAEVRYTPNSPYQYFTIEARDAHGSTARREFQFQGNWMEESILLRPDKPVYKVGETMQLTLLTTQTEGTLYLDIIRDGQTVSTRSVDVTGGKATAAVDLTPDLYGTLELHAYKVGYSGAIIRDTRLVVVSQADDLALSLTAGQESYRPGETANLTLQVTGKEGKGVQSAVGLAVVDESVFALAETDPGFAKLYFLLEKEILQPRYDLHGYSLPDLMRGLPEPSPDLESAVQGAAQASLSEAVRQSSAGGAGKAFSLLVNSHQDAIQRAEKQQEAFFKGLSIVLFGLYLAFLVAFAVFTIIAGMREKNLGRSMLIGLSALALLVLFLVVVPAPYEYSSGFDPLDRIGGWIDWLSRDVEIGLAVILLASPLAYLALVMTAIRRRDSLLGWALGIQAAIIAFGILLIYCASQIESSVDEKVAIAGLLAFLLIPIGLLVWSVSSLLKKRFLSALLLLWLFLTIWAVPAAGPAIGNSFVNVNRGLGGAPVMADGARELAVPQAAGMIMKKSEATGAAAPAANEAANTVSSNAGAQATEPPRLRQYFPETMLWLPDAVTGADGSLKLDVPVADSITTWRMTALASSQDGRLGSTSAPLRVFQDFFIDLDLPLSLTVGDEVAIPVGVFNYLPEAQTVKLELEQADWFELQNEPVQELKIAANEISVAYFRIRATAFGSRPFKVTAWGSKMSDAIQKEVRVYPDGKEIRFSDSNPLNMDTAAQEQAVIPAEAIPGTQKVQVKIYPGVLSQVVEGLDSILRMPSGCFEQTSSTTYPNLLVMDYLKTTKQAAPEVQMKAEEYINLGYQRLTTFEVDGGGFSLFGRPPADRMLTAYGLQEFSDMIRVHSVDPDLLKRAAEWLYSQQAIDGSWENDRGLVHEQSLSSLEADRLPVTAYIAWSLVEAGYSADSHTQKALQYVREFQAQDKDPYGAALIANTLVSADLKGEKHEISSTTKAVLDRLAGMATRDGDSAYWQSQIATYTGAEGKTGSIETTALAALALMRAEHSPEIANAALVYLVHQKDSFGTWHSTQATVLTLKALLQSVRGSGELSNATVTITLNGGQTKTLQITPENYDVAQAVAFSDVNVGRENHIEIRATGKGTLMYQVTGSYYLPWGQLAKYPEISGPADQVKIDVSYDRTQLAVNDTVTENVTVKLNEPGARAEQAMIDLGVPPGFSVQSEDLAALVARFQDTPANYAFPKIQRYELTGRQILLYVTGLSADDLLEFSFRLKARFPLNVQSPASSAYDYYNPDVVGEVAPQRLQVNP